MIATDTLQDLDHAMLLLASAVRKPRYWESIMREAGVLIDRPAAAILQILVSGTTQNRVQDLAVELGIESPSVTRKTQQLENLGLLTRQADAKDRRAVRLQPTKAGRHVAKKIRDAKLQRMRQAIASWPKDERQVFISLFTKFAESIAINQ